LTFEFKPPTGFTSFTIVQREREKRGLIREKIPTAGWSPSELFLMREKKIDGHGARYSRVSHFLEIAIGSERKERKGGERGETS